MLNLIYRQLFDAHVSSQVNNAYPSWQSRSWYDAWAQRKPSAIGLAQDQYFPVHRKRDSQCPWTPQQYVRTFPWQHYQSRECLALRRPVDIDEMCQLSTCMSSGHKATENAVSGIGCTSYQMMASNRRTQAS